MPSEGYGAGYFCTTGYKAAYVRYQQLQRRFSWNKCLREMAKSKANMHGLPQHSLVSRPFTKTSAHVNPCARAGEKDLVSNCEPGNFIWHFAKMVAVTWPSLTMFLKWTTLALCSIAYQHFSWHSSLDPRRCISIHVFIYHSLLFLPHACVQACACFCEGSEHQTNLDIRNTRLSMWIYLQGRRRCVHWVPHAILLYSSY